MNVLAVQGRAQLKRKVGVFLYFLLIIFTFEQHEFSKQKRQPTVQQLKYGNAIIWTSMYVCTYLYVCVCVKRIQYLNFAYVERSFLIYVFFITLTKLPKKNANNFWTKNKNNNFYKFTFSRTCILFLKKEISILGFQFNAFFLFFFLITIFNLFRFKS